VDAAHCERAAQGLRLMAQRQYRSQVRRLQDKPWMRRTQSLGRRFARGFAAVVLVAGLLSLWAGVAGTPAHPVFLALGAILLLEAAALWVLPGRADRINGAVRRRFERLFGNRAATRLDKARRAAPFEAVYDLRGDLMVYSRIENGRWTQYWQRRLDKLRPHGVALQVPGLLAIFGKPGRVMPAIIVLTADDGAVAAAMRNLGWNIVDIDPATGEPAATQGAPA
jgi:hypothetical protein